MTPAQFLKILILFILVTLAVLIWFYIINYSTKTKDHVSVAKIAVPAKILNLDNTPVTKRVLSVDFNYTLPSTGENLRQLKGWQEPAVMEKNIINKLKTASWGYLTYEIAKSITINTIPVKQDGYVYTEKAYLDCLRDKTNCHNGDIANYQIIFSDNNICQLVKDNNVDEVWLWGGPWFGFWESNLTGKDAFWYNSVPNKTIDCGKTLPVMGFSYERPDAVFENFGHRMESVMSEVYQGVPDERNEWKTFSSYNKIEPNGAGCGNVHYPPNGINDYDWSNLNFVNSSCDSWLVRDFSFNLKPINCELWKCDGQGYNLWWLNHIPHQSGKIGSKLGNWWRYFADWDNVWQK